MRSTRMGNGTTLKREDEPQHGRVAGPLNAHDVGALLRFLRGAHDFVRTEALHGGAREPHLEGKNPQDPRGRIYLELAGVVSLAYQSDLRLERVPFRRGYEATARGCGPIGLSLLVQLRTEFFQRRTGLDPWATWDTGKIQRGLASWASRRASSRCH